MLSNFSTYFTFFQFPCTWFMACLESVLSFSSWSYLQLGWTQLKTQAYLRPLRLVSHCWNGTTVCNLEPLNGVIIMNKWVQVNISLGLEGDRDVQIRLGLGLGLELGLRCELTLQKCRDFHHPVPCWRPTHRRRSLRHLHCFHHPTFKPWCLGFGQSGMLRLGKESRKRPQSDRGQACLLGYWLFRENQRKQWKQKNKKRSSAVF